MKKYYVRRTLQAISLVAIIVLLHAYPLFAENVKIIISPDKSTGQINRLIFGSSMIAYDYTHLEYKGDFVGYSNYGAGIWNPAVKQSVPEVINLAKDTGMTIARFPGGSGSLFYNWKKTIGPTEKRPKNLFGLDEFLKVCEEIGVEVLYTLPYVTGSSEDAADLVEYLNAPDNKSNPNGGIDWAAIRAGNGHPEPYGVTYFELGNEVNYGVPAHNIPGVAPALYAKDYIDYKQNMNKVDSSIKLGAVTVNSNTSKGISPWNEELFRLAGNNIDFLIDHTYVGSSATNSNDIDSNILFTPVFEELKEVQVYYAKLGRHFEKITGRKDIPIAVTEYNFGMTQESPVPLRHSLGAALVNAGLLQIFMKPTNNILMANYWQFVNSAWGLIKNDEYAKGTGTYIKRPNYYMFKMYHDYMGDELIDVHIADNKHAVAETENNILSNVNWKTKFVFGADIEVRDEYLEITFNGNRDMNFHQVYKKAAVKPNTIYKLSGLLKADNLKDHEGVGLAIEDDRGWKKTQSAAVTERVWGTTDWVRVELEYTTLSDATGVSIMVRRLNGKGEIKGKVYVKDIKLVERKEIGLKGGQALSISASKTINGKTLYLMVLNKSVNDNVEAVIHPGITKLSNTINIRTLNGPGIMAVNEKNPKNVVITHKSITVDDIREFQYSFPSHSLTSLEFKLDK